MDSELKAKWVAALRSGKYLQAREQLRSGESFCCLGVLCDVYDPSKWNEDDYQFDADTRVFSDLHINRGGKACLLMDEKTNNTLVEMNDKGDDFNKIADYIEANLEPSATGVVETVTATANSPAAA